MPGNSAALRRVARINPRRKCHSYPRLSRLVQSIGAGRQIDGRADRGHGAQRRPAAPLPGQLQHQVAAHGVAHQRHPLQAEALRIVAHHRAHVAGKPGVVERGRQRIRAAAVAHVHADHVAAGIPGARGNALNVARVPTSPQARGPAPASAAAPVLAPAASGNGTARGCHRRVHLDGLRTEEAGRRTGKKLPTIVCRWPLLRPRRGSNGVSHSGSPGGVGVKISSGFFRGFLGHGTRQLGPRHSGSGANPPPVRPLWIGAASGDRTHDILSHSQAFCR
jgi:hypothetical protein